MINSTQQDEADQEFEKSFGLNDLKTGKDLEMNSPSKVYSAENEEKR